MTLLKIFRVLILKYFPYTLYNFVLHILSSYYYNQCTVGRNGGSGGHWLFLWLRIFLTEISLVKTEKKSYIPSGKFVCKFVYRFLVIFTTLLKKKLCWFLGGKLRKLTLKNTLNCQKIINEFSARIEDFLNEK